VIRDSLRRLAAVCAIFILAGCAGGATPTKPETSQSSAGTTKQQGPKHLRIAQPSPFTAFDPHKGTSGSDHETLWAVFDSLFRFDKNGSIIPGQAKKWEFPDPKTMIITLNEGIRFTDGTPLDAEAVKWNIERIKDPKEKTVVAEQLAVISTVEVLSPTQLKLVLTEPAASLAATLSDRPGMMISPTAYKKLGPDFARNPVGAGPFKLVEWKQDAFWTLERNPDFFEKGLPKLDKITFYQFQNAEAAVSALKSGQIDFYVRVAPTAFAWVKSSPDFTFVDQPTTQVSNIYLNRADPPLNNLKLRQAIAYAIDREAILRVNYGGVGTVAEGVLPLGYWAKDSSVKAIPYDPKKAAQLVKESGYDGKPIRIVVSNEDEYVKNMQIVQQMLDQVGIKVEIVPLSSAATYEEWFNKGAAAGRSVAWSGRVDPDLSLAPLFGTGGAYNAPMNKKGLSDPRIDELLSKGRQASDQHERQQYYAELDKIITSEVHMITFVHKSWAAAVRNNITGFEPNPLGKALYLYFDMK
jgi:peptide/nickel transport system substrate-binding protein